MTDSPPLIERRYATIVADPPWPMPETGTTTRGETDGKGRYTAKGGRVVDGTMGSGTTALVARRLGRKSIGIELNSGYCELAARRLGQQSLLAEPAAQ